MLTIEDVQLAYRKLKHLVYYDKTDLRLRLRLAEFECDPDLNRRLQTVKRVVNSEDPVGTPPL